MSGWLRYGLVVALISCDGTIGVLVPPYLASAGFDLATIGVLVAVVAVVALLSRVPSGVIYRPERARWILASALLAMGSTAWVFPVLSGTLAIGLAQAVIGLAFGLATTTNMAMLMDALAPGSNRHRAMGYYAGSLSAGHMMGSLLGGVVGDVFGFTVGFRLATLCAAIALILLMVDRSAPRIAPAFEHGATGGAHGLARPSWAALKDPKLATLSLVALLLNFLLHVLTTFAPLHLLQSGFSLTEIGFVKSAHSFINTITRPLAGPAITWLGVQRVYYVGLALLTTLMIAVPGIGSFWLLAIAFVGCGVLRSVTMVANTIGIADLDESRISRGMTSGIYNASKDVGNLAGPIACGAVATVIGLGSMLIAVPVGATAVFFVVAAALEWRPRRPAPTLAPASPSAVSGTAAISSPRAPGETAISPPPASRGD